MEELNSAEGKCSPSFRVLTTAVEKLQKETPAALVRIAAKFSGATAIAFGAPILKTLLTFEGASKGEDLAIASIIFPVAMLANGALFFSGLRDIDRYKEIVGDVIKEIKGKK